MNRNLLLSKLCIGMGLLGLMACSDDKVSWPEVDGGAPDMVLKTDHIRTDHGYSITIKGQLADADGIASISLECPTLYLNKTIDIIGIYGEPLKTYNLDYTHPINDLVSTADHHLTVTVTDVGGRSVSNTILVTMDADFQAPVFTIAPGADLTVLVKDPTVLKVNFGIEDNKSLKYVRMYLFKGEVPVFGEEEGDVEEGDVEEGDQGDIEEGDEAEMLSRADDDDEDLSDAELEARSEQELEKWIEYYTQFAPMEVLEVTEFDGASYTYNKRFEIPDEEETYTLVIRAEDNMYHAINHTSYFRVQELPDFEEMYLADVQTAAELNSDVFGVPILIDHVGDFEYEARYYNATAGTEICFLPQDTDFSPICFAPSKDDPNTLGDDIDDVNKFVLDQAGVYYRIRFNTMTREYSVSTYSLADAHDPVENMTIGANQLNTWQAWGSDVGDAWWQPWYIRLETWMPSGDWHSADDPYIAELVRDSKNPHIFRTEPFSANPGSISFIVGNWHSHGWWGYTEWRSDNPTNPQKCLYLGRWFEDNPQFKGNAAYFEQKWPDNPELTMDSWNDGKFYDRPADNWFNPTIPRRGNYIFEVDFHTERCRMIPAN